MKKKILRALALFFIPPIGAFIIRTLYFLNKKNFYTDETVTKEPNRPNKEETK